jgi:hypothetical protein
VDDPIVQAVRRANAEQVLAGLAINDAVRIRRIERQVNGQPQWMISMPPAKPPARAAPIVDVHGLDHGPSRCGA